MSEVRLLVLKSEQSWLSIVTKVMAFKFRKGADNGSWCTILLPLCLMPFLIKSGLGVYLLQFAICSTCCIFSLLTRGRTQTYNSYTNGIYLAGFSIPLSLFLSQCFSYNVIVCYIICCITLWYYSYLVDNLLSYCPGSFTLGEAQVISQGVILFLHCCIIVCLNKCNLIKSLHAVRELPESIRCLQVLLLGTFLLVQTLYAIPILRQRVQFFISCFTVLFIMMFAWHMTLKKNIFVWLFYFCIYNKTRILLLLFWIFCTVSSVLVVILTNRQKNRKASTITRKYFHLIINAIYIPGIMYDLELLRFASGVALTIFILLEVCRILNVHIIGPMIEDAFQVFLDEKDSGFLILTHIYLLIGCSSPFWLSGYNFDTKGFNISLFSGVISVGFGDTAAAIGGTLFGRHTWKGSKKTYEGSICAFTVQLIVSLLFLSLGHLFSTKNVLLVLVSIFLTSLLEAKTTQVDNLVLPLFLFSFTSWIQ